jgi:plasmid stabilization system protein ParE
MSREILYHSAVQGEIRKILEYYGGISEQLADDFWEELTDAFEYARRFPERHHFDSSGRRRSNLNRFPYHFLFRMNNLQIKVTVVRHNSRGSSYGSRRT